MYLAHDESHVRVRHAHSVHFYVSHYTIYTPYICLLLFRGKTDKYGNNSFLYQYARFHGKVILLFFSPFNKTLRRKFSKIVHMHVSTPVYGTIRYLFPWAGRASLVAYRKNRIIDLA